MISNRCWNRIRSAATLALLLSSTAMITGCNYIGKSSHAIPASRLDPNLFPVRKETQSPILLTALGQEKPAAHRVGPGDTLAVFVYGIVPGSTNETPVLQQYQSLNQIYYPPNGGVVAPTTGLPLTVQADGTLELPLVGSVSVEGLTIPEVTQKLITIYREKAVIQPGRERITVSLVIPRVKRIVVMRQDSPNTAPILTNPGVVNEIHKGSGQLIDLPAYENDVLHALAYSGGLPGTDAAREIWVMRNCATSEWSGLSVADLEEKIARYEEDPECGPSVIRIPLYSTPGAPLPFQAKDVLLNEGDVVYVPRRYEYFYTGGLLGGAKIPLPADEDLDVIEAISLATGSVSGPLGQSGVVLASGKGGWGYKPNRVLILRKMPDGSQLPIRVDLARAMTDPKERINIMPDDVVLMHFKPLQGLFNGFFSHVNLGAQMVLSPSLD